MSGIILPPRVKKIMGVLRENGFESYAVGGCVRDSLLGKTPDDWDLTTNAPPEAVTRCFRKNSGVYSIPTGLKHGTVTVVAGGRHVEVTTYRLDGVYSDGRRPDEVRFTSDLREDMKRRDFTINAMAYNDTDGLVDYFGGTDDLSARVIRCVGDASERFAEDYLRMLRAYRFSAVLGFTLDDGVKAAVSADKRRLSVISAERIRTETEKTLLKGSISGIRQYFDCFCEVILPEASGADYDLLSIMESDPVLRLSALFSHCAVNKAEDALLRLKYDNKTRESVKTVLSAERFTGGDLRLFTKNLIRKHDFELAKHILAFQGLDLIAFQDIAKNAEPCRIQDLKISGNDLMREFGIGPSKQIGETLNRLLDMVIKNPETNDYDKLAEAAATRQWHE